MIKRFRRGVVGLAVVVVGGLLSAAPPAGAAASCPAGVRAPSGGYQQLRVTGVTCPMGSADPGRVLDYTFSTPDLVPNATGFGVPKVPTPAARVILPRGYFAKANAKRHYPVLYLLHGAGAAIVAKTSYRDWAAGDVAPAAGQDQGRALSVIKGNARADTGLIVVMPEGGNVGMYADWVYAGSHGGSPRYESFHIGQLVPWVDRSFRTWRSGRARAIAGPSMGGMGAVRYTEAHPELFRATASFSGTLDLQDTGYGGFPRLPAPALYSGGLALEQSGDVDDVMGPGWLGLPFYVGAGPNWSAHNPIELGNLLRLAGEDLTVTSGANDTSAPVGSTRRCQFLTPDPAKTGIAAGESSTCVVGEQFTRRLRESGVKLDHYRHIEAGGQLHTWANWNGRLREWLPHVMDVLTPAR